MSDATAGPRSRTWAGAFLALAAGWVLMVLLVDPRGDFPINDDFAYAWSVLEWMRTGTLRLSQWASPSSVFHIAWGRLFAELFGFGHETLRLSCVVMGGLGASSLFLLTEKESGLTRVETLVAAALLLFNPLYASMAFSFHTEVTYCALIIAATACYARGMSRPESGGPWLLAGSLLTALSVMTRQFGILLALGAAAAILHSAGENRWKRALLCSALPLTALAAFLLWFHSWQGGTWAVEEQTGLILERLSSPRILLRQSLLRASAVFLYMGGFLFPLAVGFLPGNLRTLFRRPGRPEAFFLGGALLLVAATVAVYGPMPHLDNVITRRGLGVVTLHGFAQKAAGWWGSLPFRAAVTAACLAGAVILSRVLWEGGRPEDLAKRRTLLWLTVPQAIPFFVMPQPFDRYLLGLLPGAILIALLHARGRPVSRRLCAAGCLALWALTTAGLMDHFAWRRAAREAVSQATARGVPPGSVENGFDWDAWFNYAPAMDRLLATRPHAEIGPWEWATMYEIRAKTSFDPRPAVEGLEYAGSVPYRTPLAGGKRSVHWFLLR